MNTETVGSPVSPRKPIAVRPDLSGFLVPAKNELPWILADLWSEAQDAIEAKEKADAAAAMIVQAAADALAKAQAEEAAKVKAAADLEAQKAAIAASVVQCSHVGCQNRMLPERAFWRGDKQICRSHSVRTDISWELKQRQEKAAADFRAKEAEAKARARAEATRREETEAARRGREDIARLLGRCRR